MNVEKNINKMLTVASSSVTWTAGTLPSNANTMPWSGSGAMAFFALGDFNP